MWRLHEFVACKFNLFIPNFVLVSEACICFPLFSQLQVSANCAETIAFVEELTPNDPLIKGVSDDKNPYKGDKGGCTVT